MIDLYPNHGSGDSCNDFDSEQSSFGKSFGLASPPPAHGYHFRDDGRKCPRGHSGPFRNSRYDYAECRRIFALCWKVTRCAVHSVIHGCAMSPRATRIIGTTPGAFLTFLQNGCDRLGLRIEEYGQTWGIYRRRQLNRFDLTSDAVFWAVNHLENLKVALRHNSPRSTEICSGIDDRGSDLFQL